MPKITVSTSLTPLPPQVGRKQLFVRANGDVKFSWRTDLTYSTAATEGMPLTAADGIMALGGKDLDLSAALYFIAASGTVDLWWEEKA
jgi:hypothetical protein